MMLLLLLLSASGVSVRECHRRTAVGWFGILATVRYTCEASKKVEMSNLLPNMRCTLIEKRNKKGSTL
uniref:Putative secreted protein n=1 Tax=Anopheles triannulatus TaxID=58253 RepID=A0A2M4B1P8_9DIPT